MCLGAHGYLPWHSVKVGELQACPCLLSCLRKGTFAVLPEFDSLSTPELLGACLSPSLVSPQEVLDFRFSLRAQLFYMDAEDPSSDSNASTVNLLPTEPSSSGQTHDIWRHVLT